MARFDHNLLVPRFRASIGLSAKACEFFGNFGLARISRTSTRGRIFPRIAAGGKSPSGKVISPGRRGEFSRGVWRFPEVGADRSGEIRVLKNKYGGKSAPRRRLASFGEEGMEGQKLNADGDLRTAPFRHARCSLLSEAGGPPALLSKYCSKEGKKRLASST